MNLLQEYELRASRDFPRIFPLFSGKPPKCLLRQLNYSTGSQSTAHRRTIILLFADVSGGQTKQHKEGLELIHGGGLALINR